MHCPFCSAADTKVIDSRLVADGDQVRRRRECVSCKERFTTYETAELLMPRVVKQDGTRQPFDEEKLRMGILKALEKRPVSTEEVEAAITRIKYRLRQTGERELKSIAIGEDVMTELQKLDQVAFVRFASVYRSFQDINEFRVEIDRLSRQSEKNLNNPEPKDVMFSIQDREFMARAIRLARKGLYTTDPNPRVGCVIVNNELVVGEGWHEFAGGPHAEVNALRVAGELARGGTAYVTLEPCSHFGKTPPCADALIEAGVSKVIAAMQDPNPQVAGQGFERLRAAGVEVLSGLLEQEAEALNPGFVKRMRTGLPLVRIKLAMSVDGRTAMRSGESQWITGADAREDVQRLRARSSAIVTGSGTVLHDDPSLTVRSDSLQATGNVAGRGLRQPLRVILDSDCQMDPKAKVLTQDGACVIATAHGAYIPDELASIEGLSVVPFSVQETQYGTGIDLNQLLHWLGKQNCNEVLVEAGARLCGQFVQQKLVDELWVYMAPVLMGSEARPLLELPLQSMADRLCLSLRDMRMLGSDIRMIYSPDHSGQQAEPAQTVVAKES